MSQIKPHDIRKSFGQFFLSLIGILILGMFLVVFFIAEAGGSNPITLNNEPFSYFVKYFGVVIPFLILLLSLFSQLLGRGAGPIGFGNTAVRNKINTVLWRYLQGVFILIFVMYFFIFILS